MLLRHNCLCDILFTACRTAALSPRKEVPSLIPGSASGPADVFLPVRNQGKPAALDVSIISPLQFLVVDEAAVSQGYATSYDERRKRRAHEGDCAEVGVEFVPLLVETLGGWSEDAISLIREVGQLQAHQLGQLPSSITGHLFQRLAVSLWRGNASMWASRLPSVPHLVDGVL
uniref:Uncharacterized protein n=1 Tax=Amphimedon queenslandica TaxID=400682 RepID=A0A1X7UQ21_AMPQE